MQPYCPTEGSRLHSEGVGCAFEQLRCPCGRDRVTSAGGERQNACTMKSGLVSLHMPALTSRYGQERGRCTRLNAQTF